MEGDPADPTPAASDSQPRFSKNSIPRNRHTGLVAGLITPARSQELVAAARRFECRPGLLRLPRETHMPSAEDREAAFPEPCTVSSLTWGHAQIIRAAMIRREVSPQLLYDAGIIRERLRRHFFPRLEAGQLTVAELNQLYDYLAVDPLRALIATVVMHEPEAYFDAIAETVSFYTAELCMALSAAISTCEGEFETMNRNLCRAHADKISNDIKRHHENIVKSRRDQFWI